MQRLLIGSRIGGYFVEGKKWQEMLKMKKVETKDTEQFNNLLRYVFQVTNQDLQTTGWESGEIAQAKKPVLKQADVLGWYHGDKLISQIAVYPFQVNIFGQVYQMGGVTGVGTYPEYSSQGLMSKLIHQALTNMRERKQSISFLYPYSIPYYRHKGWEIISDKISFTIKDSQLPKITTVPGIVERTTIEDPVIRDTYLRFALQTHGAMIRNELAWEETLRWDLDDLTAAIYYDNNSQPMGYLLYWISEEVFHIKEWVFINNEARTGLWNFISAHFSMINSVKGHNYKNEPIAFLLEDSDIKETIKPNFMARIVDIRLFLEQYSFQPQPFDSQLTFNLQDPILDWNRGTFTVKVDKEGKAQLTQGGSTPTMTIDIQTLTTMLMGYKRPTYLKEIGRLKADEADVQLLEGLIIREQPYISDYF